MVKLYIAEKPSLGRAIADALPKPLKKHDGYIEAANGDMVSWCIGHILEQAEPEVYNSEFKKWQMAHLPIIPQQWQLIPKSKTRSQLTVLRKLVKQAQQLVHAGDPDREGQLLVDEVINYLNVPQAKKDHTQRLLISDLNLAAVKRALTQMQPNSEFIPLSISALARSRADWLYGINLTRAYTLQGQKSGYNGVLSVGRVQTPVLGLVVQRDLDIKHFISKDYYEVLAHLITSDQQAFSAKWQPSEACVAHMDEESRIINKALAQNVASRISNQSAIVTNVDKQTKKNNAPLPYNLSALQIDAAKQLGLNAKTVLDVCQSLYEKHKLITYPRSDCRYLPQAHFKEASSIIKVIGTSQSRYAQYAKQVDCSIKSKAWNDSKVGAHHAIIPTPKSSEKIKLSSYEQSVYDLITRQYLAQFFDCYKYQQTKVDINIANGLFTATANQVQQLGWKVMYQNQNEQSANESKHEPTLPLLSKGDQLHCDSGEVLAKQTQPPKPFTDATLLSAMTGISRFVTEPELKKTLKETDGLGTEATRAGIIELLFKRGFLTRNGKNINATEIGIALIQALPDTATRPDMTAKWEKHLNELSERKSSYQAFMTPLYETINAMINGAQQQSFSALPQRPFKKSKPKRRRAQARSKKPIPSS